jgi:uncharacterized membrane protein
MHTLPRRLKSAHRIAASHTLTPLLLSSLLAATLLAGRFYLSRSITFGFLAWNLVLAWVPYLASLWASHNHHRYPGRWWRLLLPGALWLAFFPNAPYIMTDFWHLRERLPIPMWYDLGMLAAFAWTGLFLAVHSLRTMHGLVSDTLGRALGWLFVLAVAGLGGLGIYLGRFLRWNSWDLVLNPRSVLADVALRLANPLQHPRTFGVTLLFAALLLVSYLTLTAREPAPYEEKDRPARGW